MAKRCAIFSRSFLPANPNYRIIDLKSAFTANSNKGIWLSEQNPEDSLTFKKFGINKALARCRLKLSTRSNQLPAIT